MQDMIVSVPDVDLDLAMERDSRMGSSTVPRESARVSQGSNVGPSGLSG